MKEIYEKCILNNLWFKVLSAISVVLIIISFILPPTGEIHPSVMAAVGEIFAFAALGTVIHAIDKDKTISMTHGDTTITVNGKTYKLEEKEEDE
jgi:hypothetical protein